MAEPKAKTQLQKLGFLDTDKKNSKHDIIQLWVYENAKKVISETIMAKSKFPVEIEEIRWEHQVMNRNGSYKQLVGYIDLMVRFNSKFYSIHSKDYVDDSRSVFIEVKTSIPNVGALIRQMRAYQSSDTYAEYYLVVAPDDRFKKLLNEQRFWFYKYQDPTLLF